MVKTTRIPDSDSILNSLQNLGLYGETSQTDRFYDRFIEQIAGHEKAGIGLVMAWQLAQYDTLRDYPAAIVIAINMNFDRVVDAITHDQEVAADAKNFMQEVLNGRK